MDAIPPSPSDNVTPLRKGEDQPVGYRAPPCNIEAEMGLLGAILANNNAFYKVSEFLRSSHFSHGVHQRVFEAISRLIERGQTANPITLKPFLENDGGLAEIGGIEYLIQLAGSAVAVLNAEQYGRAILDLAVRRQLIDVGEDLVNEAYESRLDRAASDVLERAEAALFNLGEAGTAERGFVRLGNATLNAIQMAETAFKRQSHITGVTTGLIDLDRKLGGLHPSDLVILAGRPSMGKTALATNIGYRAAREFLVDPEKGAPVVFFSLEMSAEQLATRILSEQTRVGSDRIRRGDVREEDFPLFIEAAQELSQVPFYIDDTPALSIAGLRTRARRLKRTEGLGLVVVDYLQLLQGSSDGGARLDNRVQEISSITRGLKALAKELQVPVLALSQLSRAVESRDDKRPQLADLRESGSIEQDADVVMFVYREEYYVEREKPSEDFALDDQEAREKFDKWQQRMERVKNKADVIVAKQRHGPIGTVRLFFDGSLTKFDNLAENDPAHQSPPS